MNDLAFRGRVKVACLKYADFITLEAASVPAHSTRIKWAQQTMLIPDGAAGTVTPTVVMDPAVQTSGAAITDSASAKCRRKLSQQDVVGVIQWRLFLISVLVDQQIQNMAL